MKIFKFLLFYNLIFIFCFSSNSWSENWLIQESKNDGIYVVIPARLNNGSISGVEVKNLELYKRDKKITDYGFEIQKDGHHFKFDHTSVSQFYLRNSSNSFKEGRYNTEWSCLNDFFNAVVDGQEERILRDYPGLSSFYPVGTKFNVKYVSTTEVLGKKMIQEKMMPIEVWGLANSKENAEIMANYFKTAMINSTYHYISATHEDFHGNSQLQNDSVEVKFDTQMVYTKTDKGNVITGYKYREAEFSMTLSLNGFETKWDRTSKEGRRRVSNGLLWYWTDPGWHDMNIGGRHIKTYVRSEGKNTDVWVRYKGSSTSDDLSVVNVRIPQCN